MSDRFSAPITFPPRCPRPTQLRFTKLFCRYFAFGWKKTVVLGEIIATDIKQGGDCLGWCGEPAKDYLDQEDD